ncbi:phosphatase [Streptomyces sp. ICBB 8177]|nr:phosphatase [Streptomyces sp. ICBB 8177]
MFTRRIATPVDVATARLRTARLLAAAKLPPAERLRLLTSVSQRLREEVLSGRSARLRLRLITDPHPAVHAEVATDDSRAVPLWQTRADLPHDTALPVAAAAARKGNTSLLELAEGLLDADSDVQAVLDLLDEHQELVAFYRDELQQTNRGLLALHAELDAAVQARQDLLVAEQKARAAAEAARNRLTFLSTASASLTTSLDHDDVVDRLTALLVPAQASSALVWLLDERDRLTPAGSTRNPPKSSPSRPITAAARTGLPHYAAPHPAPYDSVTYLPTPPGAGARNPAPVLALPLTTPHATLGTLALTAPSSGFEADDVVMLIELARRAATAIDNALRYQHERNIAETLQRAMLTDLPSHKSLSMAARYLPAGGMNIGGDWYDAFTLPDGTLIGAIGDVTGHGMHAAIMMGQLRNALRAYALEGHSPGALLTRLHQLLRQLEPDLYATAVIIRVEPDQRHFTWASAGHPPSLLREADGQVHRLDAPAGPMLGLPIDKTFPEHQRPFPPGSAVLLYTDGLVERRTTGIDPGIDQLASNLSSLGHLVHDDLDTAAETILERMLANYRREDDVCLLLCHADRLGLTGTQPELNKAAGTLR